jgi:Protein of unknown function (DUF3179)
MAMNKLKQNSRRYWLVIVACLVITLFCLIYPIYVIRPFRAQGVRELAAALLVLRFRSIVMGACVLVAILASFRYRRVQPSVWRRIAVVTGALGVCIFTALSRVNVYELMFHPIGSPEFISAAESKLDKDEKVIAIQVNGVARAYPIRGISYHHIVNDTVGGVPIVATY